MPLYRSAPAVDPTAAVDQLSMTDVVTGVTVVVTVSSGALVVTSPPQTAPAAPTVVSAQLTGTTVYVDHNQPNNGGSPITQYYLYVYFGGTGVASSGTADTTHLYFDLDGFYLGKGPYRFTVVAENIHGRSPESAMTQEFTLP